MTEPIKETTFLIPGSACRDCAYISNIKERQVDNTARLVVVEGVLPLKINWTSFRWIIGGLVAAAVIVIGANFTLLTIVDNSQRRMELVQMSMSKDIENLKSKIDVLHKIEK